MRFEFVKKSPGYKLSLLSGNGGQFTFYIGTHTHPYGKFYFFRSIK